MKERDKEKMEGAGAAKEMKEKMNAFSDMAEQVAKNYEQAIRSGLKMQQEAGEWWSTWVTQTMPAADWQKRMPNFSHMVNEYVPAARDRMEEVSQLMEKNTRTGTELLKKAADAAKSPTIADCQAKWMDFWASSLEAARSSTEAMAQINAKAIESWIDYIQQGTEVTEVRVPKA
jgi:hypothetical protein